jgi:general secretion pathway protein F
MIFNYKAIDTTGIEREGSIEAINVEVAISSLQRRGLVISSIKSPSDNSFSRLRACRFFQRVSNKDIVVLSRQMSILFQAQVSALRIFRLLGTEAENPLIRTALIQVSDDLQGGSSISKALQKHPNIFSNFYVNMVKSGEESGKLDQTFAYLADYLDRTYEVNSKARNALIYPAFVISTFVAVMILMFTVVIPKLRPSLHRRVRKFQFIQKLLLEFPRFLFTTGFSLE